MDCIELVRKMPGDLTEGGRTSALDTYIEKNNNRSRQQEAALDVSHVEKKRMCRRFAQDN